MSIENLLDNAGGNPFKDLWDAVKPYVFAVELSMIAGMSTNSPELSGLLMGSVLAVGFAGATFANFINS